MKKFDLLLTLVFIIVLSGCATSGSHSGSGKKRLADNRSSSEAWEKYYTKEAGEWRQDGIEPMAQYFEIRASEEREKRSKTDSGILGWFYTSFF